MSKEIAIAEVRTMANSVTKSGMFGLKNPEQAFTLMLIAQAEGIHPIQAIQKYSIINGMPSLKSTEVQARFQKSGGKVQWVENNDKKAICKLSHPDCHDYTSEFTMEMATKMGLAAKDNWKKMPKQMLMARAISSGVRAIYPDCLNNMYSVEEAQDIEPVETEEIEDTEIEENNTDQLKLSLKNKLVKLNFVTADVKDFATKFNLAEDMDLLKALVEDEKLLLEKVNEFEN